MAKNKLSRLCKEARFEKWYVSAASLRSHTNHASRSTTPVDPQLTNTDHPIPAESASGLSGLGRRKLSSPNNIAKAKYNAADVKESTVVS